MGYLTTEAEIRVGDSQNHLIASGFSGVRMGEGLP